MGWGMDLALCCDIRICSDNARFASLFVKRGLVPDVGGFWRLPKIVGPSKAAELLLTGDMVNAEESLAMGMVSKVVPFERLQAEALAMAKKIAANPPLSTRYIKEGLRLTTWPSGEADETGVWVMRTLRELFATEDHKEGAAAFIEKREPKFTGKVRTGMV